MKRRRRVDKQRGNRQATVTVRKEQKQTVTGWPGQHRRQGTGGRIDVNTDN